MKSKVTILLLSMFFMLFASTDTQAVPTRVKANPTVETPAEKTELTKKETRIQKRLFAKNKKVSKWMAKMEKKMADKAIDLKDPTKKWMWFWIFGWGGALLLTIIGAAVVVGSASTLGTGGLGAGVIITLLASLLGLFGTISLVIWLVKKFT